jgi:threonyl-tRNA synthetase
MLHRAILGSYGRFIANLIESTGGAFPVWLAPVQVAVLPISEKHLEYASRVTESLKVQNIRAELDSRSESLGAKIRDAEMQKVPFILVMGDKETEAGTVAVRTRGQKETIIMSLDQFISKINIEIVNRSNKVT